MPNRFLLGTFPLMFIHCYHSMHQ